MKTKMGILYGILIFIIFATFDKFDWYPNNSLLKYLFIAIVAMLLHRLLWFVVNKKRNEK
jgi:hypothetical protein